MNETNLDDIIASATEDLLWGNTDSPEDLYIDPLIFSNMDDPFNPADDLFEEEYSEDDA